MRHSRRSFLLMSVLALVPLSAFGQSQNAASSNKREDVWKAIPAFFLEEHKGFIPQPVPFEAEQTTVVSYSDNVKKEPWPLPGVLFQELRGRYPEFQLANLSPATTSRDFSLRRYFNFGAVQFKSSTEATCDVSFSVRRPEDGDFLNANGTFSLTRPDGKAKWKAVSWELGVLYG